MRTWGTMEKTKKAWVVRPNPHYIARISEFLKGDLVALGWPKIGSLAGKDHEQIKAALRANQTNGSPALGYSAGALNTLVNRVNPGDFVLVPSPEDGAVYIGEFRGQYRYSRVNKKDHYPHQRKVVWLVDKNRIPRSSLPPVLVRSLKAHQPIFSVDVEAVRRLIANPDIRPDGVAGPGEADTDGAMVRIEGEVRRRSTLHRTRDQRLRDEKVKHALRAGGGRLICEVPGCSFDFENVYGRLGKKYAQVHHRERLSSPTGRRETRLADLAIVCANCHAMIHRHGKCRTLEELIQK